MPKNNTNIKKSKNGKRHEFWMSSISQVVTYNMSITVLYNKYECNLLATTSSISDRV